MQLREVMPKGLPRGQGYTGEGAQPADAPTAQDHGPMHGPMHRPQAVIISDCVDPRIIQDVFRPLDILALHEQFRTAEPFPHVVIDDFIDRDFALEVARSFPSYEDTSRSGQEYRSVNERRKAQLPDQSRFPPAVKRLCDALHSTELLADIARITGIPEVIVDDRLIGGGIHQTGRGGRLDVHADFNYLPDVEMFRRLNLLLFLNPEWEDTWGGELELWDRDMTRCLHSIPPILGRCVIFATGVDTYHGTTTIKCPEGITRKSYAVYYYSYSPPAGFDNQFQSTVFKARPNERLKRGLLMPLADVWHGAAWRGRKLVARAKSAVGLGPREQPRAWGYSEERLRKDGPTDADKPDA